MPSSGKDFRRRAIGSGVAAFGAAALSLALAYREAPLVWHELVGARWAAVLHLATAVAAMGALAALGTRQWRSPAPRR
jgi:cytochrome d ubiquinol oxidase subunit II